MTHWQPPREPCQLTVWATLHASLPVATVWSPGHGSQDPAPKPVAICPGMRVPEVMARDSEPHNSSHSPQVLAPALATANKQSSEHSLVLGHSPTPRENKVCQQ